MILEALARTEQAKRMAARRPAPRRRTIGQETVRAAHRTGGAMAEGTGDIVGILFNPLYAVLNRTGLPQKLIGEPLPEDLGGAWRQTVRAPAPETRLERIVDEGAAGVASGGPIIGGARSLARQLTSEVARRVATVVAKYPAAEAAAGAGAGAGAQSAEEAGAGPVGRLAAGLAGGIVGGGATLAAGRRPRKAPVRREAPPEAPVPERTVEQNIDDDAARLLEVVEREKANGIDRFAAPRETPELVGNLPKQGLAPANVGKDGKIYVGREGGTHFEVMEKHADAGPWDGGTGFVTPDGQYLNRSEALAWVTANEKKVKPSANMGDELDALDYRDQVVNRRPAEQAAEELPYPVPSGSSRAAGTAPNISLDRLNTTDDVARLLKELQDDIPENGPIGHSEIREQANALGLTEEQFLKSRGLAGLEAYAVKSRDLLKTISEDTVRILEEAGDLDDPKAQLALTRLAAVSEHVQGTVSGPAGRILNSFKIGAERVQQTQVLTGAMATARGRARVQKLINQYRGDPDALAKIARDAVDPTMRDRVFSFRYNMMLSGPKTHVYNILGNTSNIIVDIAEHGVASVVGQHRRLAGDLDRVTGREVAARITGAIVGARNGLTTMRQAFKEGRPLDDASRADMERGRVSGWEIPVKALAAEDEMFRSIANMSNMYGMAVRTAVKEGMSGEHLGNRIQYLINNPTKEMIASSTEYAKRMRFVDDPSGLGRMIENARRSSKDDTLLTGIGRDAVSLLVPFVRTPDSLARTAFRRSPLGVLEGVNIKDFKAGGARRDLAMSRIAVGSGVTAYVASRVLDGEITGEGPRDYKKRMALELTGWQPRSVKVGDKYYSYDGLEPLSLILSGVATTMERWKEGGSKSYMTQAANQVFNAAEVITHSAWAETLADFFEVMESPANMREGAVNSFFANLASSFVVPAAVRQTNQAYFDNITRDTRGDDSIEDKVIGRIQSGIPGLSDNLPPQLDALGRPIGRGDAIGPDILSRAAPTLAENSPVAAELGRLNSTDPEEKVVVNRVNRSVNTSLYPMGRLTAQEHHNYQLVTGAYFTALMEEALNDPEYQAMNDDEKREYVRGLATDARKWAREEVFSGTEEENKPPKPAKLIPEAKAADAPNDGDEGEDFPWGEPTSMRRTEKGNAAVGGVPNSEHLDGDAIDFVPAPGVSWDELVAKAKEFFPGALVIHEYPGTPREHVHVQLNGLNAPYYGKKGVQ